MKTKKTHTWYKVMTPKIAWILSHVLYSIAAICHLLSYFHSNIAKATQITFFAAMCFAGSCIGFRFIVGRYLYLFHEGEFDMMILAPFGYAAIFVIYMLVAFFIGSTLSTIML